MRHSLFFKAIMLIGLSTLSYEASAWRIDMNFNNGTPGANAQNSSMSSGLFNDAAGATFFTTAQSYEGGMGAECNIKQGDTAYGTWGGIINHPTLLKKGDQIWFRIRTFWPVGSTYDSTSNGNRLKFLRIHTMSATTSNLGYDDWYINQSNQPAYTTPFSFIYEGEQKWSDFGSSATAIKFGVWETYEMYVKFDNVTVANGGQARIRLWKNGVLLKDITDRMTLATADAYSDRTHLFTYWNGGSPQTQKMYIDDIVLTSDVPAGRDAQGNPYVGVGNAASPPSAPSIINVQ